MSRFGLSAGQPGRVGFMPASGSPDVRWNRPATPAYLPPPMPGADVQERAEQASALIVIVLTLASTALSLYDLFLLASGS